MPRKIYVVGASTEYANWMQGELTRKMEDADLVVFTGGEDVDPSIYGEPRGKRTGSNIDRDIYEKREWDKAVALGVPIVGICRGSQFSCAMSGGRLVQHQTNPGYYHKIIVDDEGAETVLTATSTHHQAQYPYNLPETDFKLIGWTEGLVGNRFNGEDKLIDEGGKKEVEICYYPKTRALGIQQHPEYYWGERDLPEFKQSFEFLHKLLNKLIDHKL